MGRGGCAQLSYSELLSRRRELERKYLDLRFQLVVEHVDNKLMKRILRRQIAVVNTFLRHKELTELEKRGVRE
ncbi:50S ribosomal protein L29 [Treponema pallidum]|uniref:Large ribosomal subunit protein uL29 n=2 Tax=Treponema pallidum TaxID=160 RepID=A0AAU8RLM7_TREPL|nr:50S ribosomal protein L29 [Treponema pallidum]AEZ57318.1 putative ribosomal protein L29 [Treponema pallidum subsp. pertenue str. SamoaD]AEZ58387.1 putative ribosomal protein L29 [Treponema pallidum subsp. pertenue str. CDC2]AEZ59455.1 putative ribosomal protein L29 [Treponema pallidum subsp. pertenue str. Gauthier]AGK83843.1 putative ribosomal protein L29 [Treponema pallidum str. Fribourg-Blanc]AJB40218.1 putative ribosomal protein L29 [Treponema pallidum subsp. endemicum str. Bosnia A]